MFVFSVIEWLLITSSNWALLGNSSIVLGIISLSSLTSDFRFLFNLISCLSFLLSCSSKDSTTLLTFCESNSSISPLLLVSSLGFCMFVFSIIEEFLSTSSTLLKATSSIKLESSTN